MHYNPPVTEYSEVLLEYIIRLAELGYDVEDVIYLLRLAGYNWC